MRKTFARRTPNTRNEVFQRWGSRKSASPFDDPFSFDNSIDSVHRGHHNLFLRSARPVDFQFVHFRCRSQTKMQTLIGTRGVTSAAEHVPALASSAGGYKGLRPHRIARAFRATNQSQCYPVVRILDHVTQECWRRIYVVDHYIDVAIIEQVSERGSARRHYPC